MKAFQFSISHVRIVQNRDKINTAPLPCKLQKIYSFLCVRWIPQGELLVLFPSLVFFKCTSLHCSKMRQLRVAEHQITKFHLRSSSTWVPEQGMSSWAMLWGERDWGRTLMQQWEEHFRRLARWWLPHSIYLTPRMLRTKKPPSLPCLYH